MGVSWPFVVLLVYPALQVPMLWLVVRYVGLRNDDGPSDPRGYTFEERPGVDEEPGDGGERGPGLVRERPADGERCARCGERVADAWTYCGQCLAEAG